MAGGPDRTRSFAARAALMAGLALAVVAPGMARALADPALGGDIRYDVIHYEAVEDGACLITNPTDPDLCYAGYTETPYSAALDPAILSPAYDESVQLDPYATAVASQALSLRSDGLDASGEALVTPGCSREPIPGFPFLAVVSGDDATAESTLQVAFGVPTRSC